MAASTEEHSNERLKDFGQVEMVDRIRDNKQLAVERTNLKFIAGQSNPTLELVYQEPSLGRLHPMLRAALAGELNIVKHFILEEKLNIEMTDDQVGRSALHHASSSGHLEMVKWLIKAGANIKGKSNESDNNDTPIHLAAYFGHLAVVIFFIEIDEKLTYCKNGLGEIPMIRASVNGQLEVVKYFIKEKKVNIDTTDDQMGRTALHNASGRGHMGLLKWLVEEGANIKVEGRNYYYGMPIHVAAGLGQLQVVKFFIVPEEKISSKNTDKAITTQKKVNIDVTDEWTGRTSLHYASANGQLDVVRWLVQAGANVKVHSHTPGEVINFNPVPFFHPIPEMRMFAQYQNQLQENYQRRAAIHFASEHGDLEVVKCLIQAGADVKVTSNGDDGKSMPIHFAAEYGNLSVVKFFLEEIDKAMIFWKNKYGELPLHRAAIGGQLLVVRYFIVDKAVNVEVKDDRLGRTALHYASLNGNVELVKLLVQAGANVGAISNNYDGKTMPIHVAAQLGNLAVVKFFVEEVDEEMVYWKNGDGEIPMFRAALDGKVDVLKYFITERNVNIDTDDDIWGRTALHYAILKGNVDAVKWLVQTGANVKATSNLSDYKSMPIHLAARDGNLDLVKFFIEEVDEAMAYWRNRDGEIPMLIAAQFGRFEVLKYFITEKNVDIETKDYRCERTALHFACKYNRFEVIRWLIEAGADPSATSNDRDLYSMPVHLAAEFGHFDLVKFFIEEVDDAMIYWKNGDGDIPMIRAAVGGHADIVKYFIGAKGVNVKAAYPVCRKTALHDANSDYLSVELLLQFLTNIEAELNANNSSKIPLPLAGKNPQVRYRPLVNHKSHKGRAEDENCECCSIL